MLGGRDDDDLPVGEAGRLEHLSRGVEGCSVGPPAVGGQEAERAWG